MARAIDAGGIQFRMLNRSKGPAVQGPRAQADRRLYAQAVRGLLAAQPGLELREAEVEDLVVDGWAGRGRRRPDGAELRAGAVDPDHRHLPARRDPSRRGALARGPGGRPARRCGWPTSLLRLGLRLGRLKTGTPPRLDGRTIDRAGLAVQPGDDPPVPFSFLTERLPNPQIACWITHTTSATHELIRANLHRAPDLFRARSRLRACATARRSRTRSSASPIGSAIRSSSSPKASTTTRSTRTASRPRCRARCRPS